MKARTKKTGVYEWADSKVNIQLGCENGCRYCYARYNAVHRFHQCTQQQWMIPVINNKAVDKDYKLMDGAVMFPTAHDITNRNISECLVVINRLLDAGNRLLVVSKPRWNCIATICDSIKTNLPAEYVKRVMFRFTIGSVNDDVLKFWEPGAPGLKERLSCLQYAYNCGFETSVSCEPFLDRFVSHVYDVTNEYITDSFWVGMLRDFDNRVDLTGVTEGQKIYFVDHLKALQKPEIVKALYNSLNKQPLIKWKDSIRKITGE